MLNNVEQASSAVTSSAKALKVSYWRRVKLISAVSGRPIDEDCQISTVAIDAVTSASRLSAIAAPADRGKEKASMAGAIMDKSKADKEDWEREKAALQRYVSCRWLVFAS